MPSPTWHFDGDLRRIYEVPPGSTFAVDGAGFRIYTAGAGGPLMTTDIKRDIYSRWVDWHATHDWALEAFSASGGNLRPTGEFASADFTLRTDLGWRLVLADYPHETIMSGNLFAVGADSLFDSARITADSVVPRLQGAANLLTYASAGGGPSSAAIAAAVWQYLIEGAHEAAGVLRILMAAPTGATAGAGTNTETFYSAAGDKARIVATFDGAGNRAVVNLDGSP